MQSITLPRLFGKFLRFGCLAFGGPVAQIAMVREELVEREGWIGSARFNRLLAVMQALPGPEAHELCVHMGMIARGRIGGLLAGLGFMLPGLALMLLCAWAYQSFVAEAAMVSGLLLGAQIAVLAIILRAVGRIGKHIVTGLLLGAVAAIAGAAVLAGVPFWLPLGAGGLVCAVAWPRLAAIGLLAAIVVAGWVLLAGGGSPMAAIVVDPVVLDRAAAPAGLLALFLAGLKGGLLTFGGAYTAIPYVREDTVGRGWLEDGAFLDGVAVANMLPAPLVIFATFAGFIAGGFGGALVMTAGMFLPAFAFSMLFFERLEALVEHPKLTRALEGVAAAAVGVIAATLVELAMATAGRVEAMLPALAIALPALAGAFLLRGGWAAPALIAAGGLAGLVLLGG